MEEEHVRKEAYEKPTLRMIELAAEEMMGNCKMAVNFAGQMAPSCSFCSQNFGS